MKKEIEKKSKKIIISLNQKEPHPPAKRYSLDCAVSSTSLTLLLETMSTTM